MGAHTTREFRSTLQGAVPSSMSDLLLNRADAGPLLRAKYHHISRLLLTQHSTSFSITIHTRKAQCRMGSAAQESGTEGPVVT